MLGTQRPEFLSANCAGVIQTVAASGSNDTKPLKSFKYLFNAISALALECLWVVSPTAVCFFTLLFAVQKPLVLLLIGMKQNAESHRRFKII